MRRRLTWPQGKRSALALGLVLNVALVSLLMSATGAIPAAASASTVTETAWVPLGCNILTNPIDGTNTYTGGIGVHIAAAVQATHPDSLTVGQVFSLTGVKAIQVVPPASQTAGSAFGPVNSFEGVVTDFENNLSNATSSFSPGSSNAGHQVNQVAAVQPPNAGAIGPGTGGIPDDKAYVSPDLGDPSPIDMWADQSPPVPASDARRQHVFSFGPIPIKSDGTASANAYGPAPGSGGGPLTTDGVGRPVAGGLTVAPFTTTGSAGQNVVIDVGDSTRFVTNAGGGYTHIPLVALAVIAFNDPTAPQAHATNPPGTWKLALNVACGLDNTVNLITPPAPGYCTNTPGTQPNVPSGCYVHNYTIPIPGVATQPITQNAVSTNQYSLANSNGSTWTEIDAANLRIGNTPGANQSTLLTANADLFTGNAGYNQDLGIFVTDNGGVDQLLAWKESGGFAGTYSPNAAYIQTRYNMLSGHAYVFKLKWKTNKLATGATIYAGAGPGPAPWSPTSLVAKTFPPLIVPNFAVSTNQYSLANSNGSTWQNIDAVNLVTTVAPASTSTAVLGANADLFTGNAGYNQDIGIFVSDNGGADTMVAWKESGGFAGTYSPNAAFVKATYVMTGGHSYAFKLKWKTNKSAIGATIYAAAGPGPAPWSHTSLLAETIAFSANPYTAASVGQYSVANSNGALWNLMDPNLNVTVLPGANTRSIIGANVDLFTGASGYNQDIAIFVSDNGGADAMLSWKESGGFAGTYSPNAAFSQAVFDMTSGHTYVFKLKWKTNKNAPGATIYAAAGPGPSPWSNTKLTVELTG